MDITRDNLLSLIKGGLQKLDLSISALERHADVPKDTVRDFLRGKTQILRADKLQKILRILQPQEKLTVHHTLDNTGKLIPLPDNAPPLLVDFPPGCDKATLEALVVRGNAMSPVFLDNWVIYYTTGEALQPDTYKAGWQVPYNGSSSSAPYSSFIGKPCVVRLEDGSLMLRTLKAGSSNSTFTLAAYNTPDMRDVSISAAYRIVFIKTS